MQASMNGFLVENLNQTNGGALCVLALSRIGAAEAPIHPLRLSMVTAAWNAPYPPRERDPHSGL